LFDIGHLSELSQSLCRTNNPARSQARRYISIIFFFFGLLLLLPKFTLSVGLSVACQAAASTVNSSSGTVVVIFLSDSDGSSSSYELLSDLWRRRDRCRDYHTCLIL
jgi:hypothetical protein